MTAFHVCSFSTTDDLRGKALTYEHVKAAVLKAGRFSCFEASENMKRAVLFTEEMLTAELSECRDLVDSVKAERDHAVRRLAILLAQSPT